MRKRFAFAALMLAAACGGEAPSSSGGPDSDNAVLDLPEPGTPEHEGRLSFGQCAVCHTYREDQPHRIGPNLYGIYGAEAGKAEGFTYTAAMRQSGVVWDEASLDAFMEDPQAYMRGNRMAYLGEPDPEVRANIIAYLKSLGASGGED